MTDETNDGGGLDPAFAAALDPNDPVRLAERVKDLEGQVETLTKERDDALEAATGDERVGQLEKERDEAVERAEVAERKLKAKPKAVAAKDAAPKPRKFKIEDAEPLVGEELQARRDDLRVKLQAADDVEIVQIDKDGREIAGSSPFRVSGEVWKDHGLGLMLDQPVEFEGGDVAYDLGGYALLIDGKQVATQLRADRFTVQPHQKVKLVNDIAF